MTLAAPHSWWNMQNETNIHICVRRALFLSSSYFHCQYWESGGGEEKRTENGFSGNKYLLKVKRPNVFKNHTSLIKKGIFSADISIVTQPESLQTHIKNVWWRVACERSKSLMCCKSWVTPSGFKASGFGILVRGGKLAARFPHTSGEEDYASNPSNSICSNEYVWLC